MTAWLPSYFSDSLSLSLTEASQAALFPPIAAIIASGIASPVADAMVAKGTPVALVRKTAQVCCLLLCLACCVSCICNASRGCQEVSGFVASSTRKGLALHHHHARVHCTLLCRGVAFLGPSLFFTLAANLGGGGAENETLTVGKSQNLLYKSFRCQGKGLCCIM